jgi:phosphatidylglycerophosphatase A
MNQDKQPSLKKPEILFLSFFGAGFLPKAPGTWGTLATLPFLYLLGLFNPPFFLFIPFLLILTAGSCFIAEHIQKTYEVHDPQWIVIDEVLGRSW